MKVGLYRKAVNTNPAGPFILYHDEVSRWEQGRLILIGRSWLMHARVIKLPWPLPKGLDLGRPPGPPFSRRSRKGDKDSPNQ